MRESSHLPFMTRDAMRFFAGLIIFAALWGIVWFWVLDWLGVSPTLLPRWDQCLNGYQEYSNIIWAETKSTIYHVIQSFGFSLAVALFVGWITAKSPLLLGLFSPFFVFSQAVPLIAIAPLIVVWFGFGERSIVVMAGLVCFFPLVNGVISGLSHSSPADEELLHWLSPMRIVRFFWYEIPLALKHIIPSLRNGFGLAVVGTTVGEFIIGTGLGSLIEIARAQNRIDFMMISLVFLLGLGLVGFIIIWLFEAFIYWWRPLAVKS